MSNSAASPTAIEALDVAYRAFHKSQTLAVGVNPGDTLVWDGAIWADNLPNIFQGQVPWFVDSVAGSDANDGTTAAKALKTLGNLAARLRGAVIGQNTTVTLIGDFSTEDLALLAVTVATGFTLTFVGAATVAHTGTITAKTDFAAGATIPDFTDAAIVDVAPFLDKRILMTSGAAAGRWAWIAHKSAATKAALTQWNQDGTLDNAVVGASYDIQDFPGVGRIRLVGCGGGGSIVFRDLDVSAFACDGAPIVSFVGCKLRSAFESPVAMPVPVSLTGSYVAVNATFAGAFLFTASGCAQNKTVLVPPNATFASLFGIWFGGLSFQGCSVDLIGDNAFAFVSALFSANIFVDHGAHVRSQDKVWGSTSADVGILVLAGASWTYSVTQPTTTGGSGDTRLNGNIVAYANIPVALGGAMIAKDNARCPDAIEIAFSIAAGSTTAAVSTAVGTTLATTDYEVEYIEQAPTAAPVFSLGPWTTAKAVGGFQANITTDPGGAAARNFVARIKQ